MSAEHGTVAGYHRHRRAGEPQCAECRRAQNEYVQEWRRRPGTQDPRRAYARAKGRALQRLLRLYPAEFATLMNEERSIDRSSS